MQYPTGKPSASAYHGPPPPSMFPSAPQAYSTGPGPWSTDLCDCFSDVPNCCLTYWCPCIAFGQISEIVERGSTSCGTSGGSYCLLQYFTGCACLYSCSNRKKLRAQYALVEDPCDDCMVHFCCEPCALCQEYRELKNRGFDMSLGWQGNIGRQIKGVTMAPVAQSGMNR